jgi:hypothetical protein
MALPKPLDRALGILGSVRLAIPLLVLIALASIVGSLIPQGRNVRLKEDVPAWIRNLNAYLELTDIFHSWWFIALLGLLALSLVAITIRRLPVVWQAKGRGPAAGILLAHLGILIILAGMIYGGFSGFRYYTHLIEGEVTVLPPLSFVMKLERLQLEHYPSEAFRHWGENLKIPKRQESTILLLRHGSPILRATAAPGKPVEIKGITLLPARKDLGWAFDLVVRSPAGREKVVPIEPWAPPLITLGFGNPTRILAHRLVERPDGKLATEVFHLKPDGTSRSLGWATQRKPAKYGQWEIYVGEVRRYTGLHVYSRPEEPFLLAGFVVLMIGLVGYFSRWGKAIWPGAKRKVPAQDERDSRGEEPKPASQRAEEFARDVTSTQRS